MSLIPVCLVLETKDNLNTSILEITENTTFFSFNKLASQRVHRFCYEAPQMKPFDMVVKLVCTAVHYMKIFSRVLVPHANNPTLGVQQGVAAGYKKTILLLTNSFVYCSYFFESHETS